MRKLLALIAFLIFASAAHAQGACPSTTRAPGGVTTAFPITGNHCFYASTSGSNTNSGTSESAPWAAIPGMPTCTSNCAANTPTGGTAYVLRGGDVWTNSNFPDNFAWSGTSGAHIAIAPDATWFSGGSFNRIIFDAGGAVIGGTECTTGNGLTSHLNTFIRQQNQTYIDWNWIEERGQFVNNGSCFGTTYLNKGGTHITFNNFYVHNFTLGATCIASGAGVCTDSEFYEPDPPGSATNVTDHLVDDNHDGYIATGMLSGGNVGSQLTNSVVQYVANALRVADWGTFSNDTIGFVGGGLSGNHPNCVETLPPSSATSTYYLINIHLHDDPSGTFGCNNEIGNPGETDYVINWVSDQVLSTLNFPEQTPYPAIYIYNSSFASLGGTCMIRSGSVSPTTAFVAQNNHCMTTGTPTGSSQSGGMITGTISGTTTISISNNATESISAANSQGYTSGSTYVWQPTSANCNGIATNCPIGAGVNLTSTATGPLAALANDTTYGCSEQTISGMVESVCPQRAVVTRPATGAWDADAYQFSTSGTVATPTFSPAGGTYTGTQTVTGSTTTSGATLCGTIDGSTPTESGNTCGGGTTFTYTGPLSVPTSRTLKLLGTLSGFTDSLVASASYTINPPTVATPSALQVLVN